MIAPEQGNGPSEPNSEETEVSLHGLLQSSLHTVFEEIIREHRLLRDRLSGILEVHAPYESQEDYGQSMKKMTQELANETPEITYRLGRSLILTMPEEQIAQRAALALWNDHRVDLFLVEDLEKEDSEAEQLRSTIINGIDGEFGIDSLFDAVTIGLRMRASVQETARSIYDYTEDIVASDEFKLIFDAYKEQQISKGIAYTSLHSLVRLVRGAEPDEENADR